MTLPNIVYGAVRGGPGTAGQKLTNNNGTWVPTANAPSLLPGTVQQAWTDGQVVQIFNPPTRSEPVLDALDFGASGQAVDSWAALQLMLDQNSSNSDFECYLPATSDVVTIPGISNPLTMYQVSNPLGMDDQYTSTPTGNKTKKLFGQNRNRVGIMPTLLTPGNTGTQSWIGPLIICGNMNWQGPVYVTDSTGSWGSSTCLVSGGNGSPYLNYSQWDTGSINGQTQLGLEFEWNILTDAPTGAFEYLLATSYGNLPNLTSAASSALQIIRTAAFGAKQILAVFETSNGQFFITLPIGFDFTPSTKQVLGFSYDGAHAYLALDGQQPLFSPITATGTSPPAVTFTGTPTGAHLFNVVIEAGATTYKWNSDGGAYNTGNPIGTLPASHLLASGVTVNFPTGTYIAGQSWTCGTGTPTVAVTGTVAQTYFEEFVIGIGGFAAWPQTTNVFFSGLNFHLGRSRLTTQALFTGPYTPNPSGWTCDIHTKVLNDFAPANQGSTVRASFADWNVARTGATSPSGSVRNNMPLWLWTHANTIPFHDNCRIVDLFLCNPQGQGLFMVAASNSHLRDLNVQGYKGIEYENFCYPSHIDNIALLNCGDNGSGHGQKISLFYGGGSQGIHVGPNMSYSGKVDWNVVDTFGDLWMGSAVPAPGSQGFLLASSATSVFVEGVDIDDESNISTYAHFAIASATKFHLRSGFLDSNTAAIPCGIKIGLCQDVQVGSQPAYQAGVPIFSFGPGKNGGYAVQWDGQLDSNVAGTTVTIIDPLNIGPVVVPNQERFGQHALTMPGSANLTLAQPDQFWGNVAVGGSQTAAFEVIQAVHNPGKFTYWQNNTTGGFAITVIGPSGTGASIPADGLWHRVYDNGTNIVAA